MLWLNEVPLCVVNAHVAMLGPLTAEESRSTATIVGVGRSMKVGEWASRQVSEWDRAMRVDLGEEQLTRLPAGIGIKVIRRAKGATSA